MTLEEFTQAFVKYQEYYPEPVMSKEMKSIYFLGLKDLTVEQLNSAYVEIIRTRNFQKMPKIAEIRENALGETKELMNLRMQMAREKILFAIRKYGIYQSVEFDDKGIHALIDSAGGWQKICAMEQNEFEDLFKYNNFEKIYGAYWKLPRNVSQNYLGLHDNGNGTMKIKYIANSDIGVNSQQNNLIGNTHKMIGEQK
nr:MAG TPA: replisome organizer protein [Caudoviricetes sp.]